MDFNNSEELKRYILLRGEVAVQLAQEKVYAIINRFVKEYYAEFSPSLYERTYQLFRSLVKTDVRQIGNEIIAEVYFDIDLLDYHMKRIHGKTYNNKGWSEEKTLEAAMIGNYSHGGYEGAAKNTRIWKESLEILNAEKYNILKKAIIDAGIPIK